MIEVSGRRLRKRLEERHHALLPLLVPDDREPLDIGEVFDVELYFTPQGADFPAMKAGQIEQQA